MEELPLCYTVLFNAVTDAIDALQEQNYGLALERLIQGQRDAEDAYIDMLEELDPQQE